MGEIVLLLPLGFVIVGARFWTNPDSPLWVIAMIGFMLWMMQLMYALDKKKP